MAENENGQERSEEPTGKRISDAREKGQIARSREFNTFLILMAGGSFLLLGGGAMGNRLGALIIDAWTLDRTLIFDTNLLVPHLQDLLGRAFFICLPLFVALAAVAILASILIGGMNFTTKALEPKFSKLNPLTGIKRVLSIQGLMELLKGLGKFFLVGGVAVLAMSLIWERLLNLGEMPVESAIVQTAHMAAWLFLIAASALFVVAMIDVPFQLWNYQKQLRMTLQEVKDEFKDTEGKPEVKGRIRQMQYEMARKRMMSEVPKADVVITNPTHYAVAIAYEPATMRAPKLLAKGMDGVAAAIRDLAKDNGITLVEAPRVARAIYFTTELSQEIPGGLFMAVARILAYVYQLDRHERDAAMPDDLPVPEEYLDPRRARRVRR